MNPDEYFPFDGYREYQEEATELVLNLLHEKGYDNVILDAPTGVGKSGIATAVLRSFENGFYVTPQRSLREQLQEDDVLSEYLQALRARADYECEATGQDCANCEIRRSDEESCIQTPGCTYWDAKMDAVDHQAAVLTFAYLIIDGQIPVEDGAGQRLSFDDRNVLVVDECHNLESQVASLFAGFKLSPFNLPDDVFDGLLDADVVAKSNTKDYLEYDDFEAILQEALDRCESYINSYGGIDSINVDDASQSVEQCVRMIRKLEMAIDDCENGSPWVASTEKVDWDGRPITALKVEPIYVSNFLGSNLWKRSDKRVLATATMPFRSNPDRWCRRIGLDPDKTFALSVPMPFPAENRPIYTDTIINEFSNGRDEDHWGEIMTTLDRLAGKHAGQKGLIHASSYDRAFRIFEDAYTYDNLKHNVIAQDEEDEPAELIEEWQSGDKDLLVSPSMTEGVDLVDDMCRWQALVKVPYPPAGDARVSYILDNVGGGWDWYSETTATSLIQSVGRAVRSQDDYAEYYVLDGSFESIREKVAFPEWFEDAITSRDPFAEPLEKNEPTAADRSGQGKSLLDI